MAGDETVNSENEEKRRKALTVTGLALAVSTAGFAVSVSAYVQTDNIKAGAFWAQLTVFVASVLALVGVATRKDGRSWMAAGMVFGSFGVLFTFIGACVDGVQVGHAHNTDFGGCNHTQAAVSVSCGSSGRSSCSLSVPADSCYCCEVYRHDGCDSWGLSGKPSYYKGVGSCSAVAGVYTDLMWSSMALCIVAFILCISMLAYVNVYRHACQRVLSVFAAGPGYGGPGYGPPIVVFSQHTVGYYPNGGASGLTPIAEGSNYGGNVVSAPLPAAQPSAPRQPGQLPSAAGLNMLPPPSLPTEYYEKPPSYPPPPYAGGNPSGGPY